jgi:hypothetical protein
MSILTTAQFAFVQCFYFVCFYLHGILSDTFDSMGGRGEYKRVVRIHQIQKKTEKLS